MSPLLPDLSAVLPPLGVASVATLVFLLEAIIQILAPHRPERPARTVLYVSTIMGAFFVYLLISVDTVVIFTTLHPMSILWVIALALAIQASSLFQYFHASGSLQGQTSDASVSKDRQEQTPATQPTPDSDGVGIPQDSSATPKTGEEPAGWVFGSCFIVSTLLFVFALATWAEFDTRLVIELPENTLPENENYSLRFVYASSLESDIEPVVSPKWFLVDRNGNDYLILDSTDFTGEYQTSRLKLLIVPALTRDAEQGKSASSLATMVNCRERLYLRALQWISINAATLDK